GDGGGGGDRQLELVVARVVLGEVVQRDHHVGAAGLLELAHHELPSASSGAPVDVPPVVAGGVVAQGGGGGGRAGEVGGGGALEVAQEAAGRLVQPHGAGVDEQLLLPGPGDLAAHERERIVAHRADRTHHQHGAAPGGHGEQLLVGGFRAQARDHELCRGRADRELDAGGQDHARGGVGDLDPPHGAGAHHDAMGLQVQRHFVGGAAQHEEPGDEERHRQGE